MGAPKTTGSIKLNVFGCKVLVQRHGERWKAYYLSDDGKRRPAEEILVPSSISEPEVERFVADLCHEWATEQHPDVIRIG